VAEDRSIALSISEKILRTIIEECRVSNRLETGGILIGRYTDLLDRAIVDEATRPPRDSKHARTTFARGIAGLKELLRRRWRSQRHYLGEWHFHPNASSTPSPKDILQMVAFALDKSYQCTRPVLIVIGGDPSLHLDLTVTVVSPPELTTLVPVPTAGPPALQLGSPAAQSRPLDDVKRHARKRRKHAHDR
jgi:Prokaryotic homologs of the JAB domain